MQVLFPEGKDQKNIKDYLHQINDWEMVVPPFGSDLKKRCELDFWLGSSEDGKVWALAVSVYDDVVVDYSDHVEGILLSPPKRNSKVISNILLACYSETLNKEEPLTEDAIDRIVGSIRFPEFKSVQQQLPNLPKTWNDIPSEISLNFNFSENAAISESLFREYHREDFEQAMKVVCSPRVWNVLIGYTLEAREVIPFLEWDVDWPLSRAGKDPPMGRGKVQGMLPNHYEPNISLFKIYQHLPGMGGFLNTPHPYKEPVVRLRVGGRSPEEAIQNWHECANILRGIRKKVLQEMKDEEIKEKRKWYIKDLKSIENIQERIDKVAEDLKFSENYSIISAWDLGEILGLDFNDVGDWGRSFYCYRRELDDFIGDYDFPYAEHVEMLEYCISSDRYAELSEQAEKILSEDSSSESKDLELTHEERSILNNAYAELQAKDAFSDVTVASKSITASNGDKLYFEAEVGDGGDVYSACSPYDLENGEGFDSSEYIEID